MVLELELACSSVSRRVSRPLSLMEELPLRPRALSQIGLSEKRMEGNERVGPVTEAYGMRIKRNQKRFHLV